MEKLSEERLEKFKKTIEKAKSIIAIILTHLDPDSATCAKIFADICKSMGKTPKIFYAGGLYHPQNRAIWNRFALADDFNPIENLNPENLKEYDTVLLDSSSLEDTRLNGIKINPIVIIDHHISKDKLQETEDTWYEIRACGAATTLVIQLFLSLNMEFNQGDDISTLAVIALLTDADIKLLSKYVTDLDRETYVHLMKYADASKARETFDSVKDTIYLKFFKRVIDSLEKIGNYTLAHLDFIEDEDSGYGSLLADELCAIAGINTVWVSLTRNDFSTEVKARSIDDKVDLESVIKNRFGEKYGGARHGKGAVRLPPPIDIDIPTTSEAKQKFLEYRKQTIRDRLKSSSE